MKIIPTIIAKNQEEFNELFLRYKNLFKTIQIDIMDGKFVKNKSNLFNIKLPKTHKFEAHLMINNPEDYIYKNYKKFDIIIANFEKVKNPKKLIEFIKNKKKKIGFALNPETSIMHLNPYLKNLDKILILTVHPGEYGAEFVKESLEKISMLRIIYKKDIEVDGHINEKTIKLCKKSGATSFAVGSYFKNSKNLKKDLNKLNNNFGA